MLCNPENTSQIIWSLLDRKGNREKANSTYNENMEPVECLLTLNMGFYQPDNLDTFRGVVKFDKYDYTLKLK